MAVRVGGCPFRRVTFEMNDGSIVKVDPTALRSLSIAAPLDPKFRPVWANKKNSGPDQITVDMSLTVDLATVWMDGDTNIRNLPAGGQALIEGGGE